jgi:hypothetical protein
MSMVRTEKGKQMEKVLSKVIVGRKAYVEKEIAYYTKNGWKVISKNEGFGNRVSCKLEYVRVY